MYQGCTDRPRCPKPGRGVRRGAATAWRLRAAVWHGPCLWVSAGVGVRGVRCGGHLNPWPASLLPEVIMTTSTPTKVARSAAPLTGQRAHEIQAFGPIAPMPIALAEDTRRASV